MGNGGRVGANGWELIRVLDPTGMDRVEPDDRMAEPLRRIRPDALLAGDEHKSLPPPPIRQCNVIATSSGGRAAVRETSVAANARDVAPRAQCRRSFGVYRNRYAARSTSGPGSADR